jgi:VIT1/CCC1 family predicted Fe2+/Mn2+ transporter
VTPPSPAARSPLFRDAALRKGISFGLTSAVITTLGLMVGLQSGTHSRVVVLGGILTIAIADAFSDALGIHVSEEADHTRTTRQVWAATLATFLAKFVFGMSFAIPVILLPLTSAIVASLVWGFLILALLSYYIAKSQNESPWQIIGEHVGIAAVVIVVTHWLGHWVATLGN